MPDQVMTTAGYPFKIVPQLLLWLGLPLVLLGISGCGGIVQIVPISQLTPVAVEEPPTSPVTPNVDGPPTRIVAEAIGLDSAVVEMGWRVVERGEQQVSEWDMPEIEAAWHRNTARPGEGSNIVISGHNESTGGHVFAELEELQAGDRITLWTTVEDAFEYEVVDKTIVRTFLMSEEADAYLRTVSEPTAHEQLTLITCWPRWTNTHRPIVIAEPL